MNAPVLERTEPLRKEGDAADGWTLADGDRKKAKKELTAWAEALILGLATAMVDALPGLLDEGADWGGGGLDADALAADMAESLKTQGGYADGFLDDINGRIDALLTGDYTDQEAFVDSMMDMFDWAKSRAEMYAVGSGVPAWRQGALGAMRKNGIAGGHWICTFGPNSCEDCQDLHGEYMTLDEFEKEWGNQQCNGACLCGFMPSDSEDSLDDGTLAEVDAAPGDGLGEAA